MESDEPVEAGSEKPKKYCRGPFRFGGPPCGGFGHGSSLYSGYEFGGPCRVKKCCKKAAKEEEREGEPSEELAEPTESAEIEKPKKWWKRHGSCPFGWGSPPEFRPWSGPRPW
jgi:hypothetical protein